MTPEIRNKITNYWDFVPQGGKESRADIYERVYSWIEKEILSTNQSKIALFTHEIVLKCLLVGIFRVDDNVVYKTHMGNCQYIVLQYNENGWSVIESNIKELSEILNNSKSNS